MREFFQKLGYYSIFFFVSGIIHYQFCFNYTECLIITPGSVKVQPGGSIEFKAEHPTNPQLNLQENILWKISNPSFGSIDSKGKFTAGKETGEVEITVYHGEIMGLAKVSIEKPKVAAIPQALVQALKNAPKEPSEKPQEEKKEEEKKEEEKKEKPPAPPKPEEKKEEEKKEKTIYQENLEKLQQQLMAKMEELEKQKKEMDEFKKDLAKQKEKEVEEIKKQMEEVQKQKIQEMELAQQKKIQELEQEKEKQKEAQQELSKKMEEVSRRLTEMDKAKVQEVQEKEKKFQEILNKKIQEAQEANNKQLDKIKQDNTLNMELVKQNYQNQLQEKNKEVERLSQTIAEIQNNQKKTLDEIQKYKSEQSDKQQELENKIADLITKGKSESINKNTTQERTILNQQWQYLEQIKANNLGEHDRLVQKFSTNFDQGAVVPALDFFDSKFIQNLYDIMSFHKMKLIAYPETNAYYVAIQSNSYGNAYEKRTDFENLQKNFSNRSISAENGFPEIIKEIRKQSHLYQSNDGFLQLALIFPQKTADYIAWKTITVCKKFGYDPKNVAVCSAYFQKTKTGYWSLIIKALRLKNGQKVFVQDFEENW
ncbi:MAG: Ig-like domain-containing protein [Candidatus Brocadiae bacterium]|nr:Ig-like domain-containing protein [Candidatus Brocadiia bacterium]